LNIFFWLRLKKILWALTHSPTRRALVLQNVLAASEHRRLFASEFGTVIYIGANRGQFSPVAVQCSSARIYAFEPLSNASRVLRDVFSTEKRVTCVNVAIAEARGTFPINVSEKDDSSSLLSIGPKQTSLSPGTEFCRVETIESGRLSDFVSVDDIQRPALLKIDVQGYELKVLGGCEELISYFDVVYCECSFVELYEGQALCGEVISYLTARGFSLLGLYNILRSSDGSFIQADFLFGRT
jgi:FkbM family methyltransferase